MNSSAAKPINSTILDNSTYCLVPYNASAATKLPHSPDPQVLTWYCVAISLCAIGATTNIVILTIILKYPSLRKGAGIFVAHLLGGHVAILAVINPIAIRSVYITIIRPHGGPPDCEHCHVLHFFNVTFGFVIGWNEAVLAINRIVGVFFPTKYRLINRRAIHVLGLAFCWVISLSATASFLFGVVGTYKMLPLGTCQVSPTSKAFWPVMSVHIYAPLVINTSAAVMISFKFWLGNRANRHRIDAASMPLPVASAQPAKPKRAAERQKRMSTMLVTSFMVNVLCIIPQTVLVATGLTTRFPTTALWPWCFLMFQLLITPVVFLVMNEDYKNKWVLTLNELRGRKTPQQPQSRTSTRGATRPNTVETSM